MKEKEERLIQIPLEEYKQLLVIKGRYEELNRKEIILPDPKIIQEFNSISETVDKSYGDDNTAGRYYFRRTTSNKINK